MSEWLFRLGTNLTGGGYSIRRDESGARDTGELWLEAFYCSKWKAPSFCSCNFHPLMLHCLALPTPPAWQTDFSKVAWPLRVTGSSLGAPGTGQELGGGEGCKGRLPGQGWAGTVLPGLESG